MCLEKVIDRSTSDGGDGSYRLQSLMVLHLMVMKFLLQTMVTSKGSTEFYGMVISLTLLFPIEQYKELSRLSDSYWSIKKESGNRSQFSLKRGGFGLIRRLSPLRFNYSKSKYGAFI